MPWRNIPPDTFQAGLMYLGLTLGAIIGSASKITEQIRSGQRTKFWGPELATDATSFLIMLLVAAGISEYLNLGTLATVAVSGILARAGTEELDNLINSVVQRVRGKK